MRLTDMQRAIASGAWCHPSEEALSVLTGAAWCLWAMGPIKPVDAMRVARARLGR